MHERLRNIRKSFDSVTEEESIPETPEDIRRRLLSFGEIAITNTDIEYITIDSGQIAFRSANIQNIGLGDVNIANCTIPNVYIPNAVDIGVVAAAHIDIDHIRLNKDIAIENIGLHSGDINLQSVTIEDTNIEKVSIPIVNIDQAVNIDTASIKVVEISDSMKMFGAEINSGRITVMVMVAIVLIVLTCPCIIFAACLTTCQYWRGQTPKSPYFGGNDIIELSRMSLDEPGMGSKPPSKNNTASSL